MNCGITFAGAGPRVSGSPATMLAQGAEAAGFYVAATGSGKLLPSRIS